jgi:putative tricarboxylic transport membrane protein
MFVFMTGGVLLFARLMLLDRALIFPTVFAVCVLGAFTVEARMFDVWVMLAFGVVGVAMERAGVPLAPFVVGLVLAPLAEEQLRTGLMASGGTFAAILDRPVALGFLAVAAVMLAWSLAAPVLRRRRA